MARKDVELDDGPQQPSRDPKIRKLVKEAWDSAIRDHLAPTKLVTLQTQKPKGKRPVA
jgi:hypothetical protein